MWSGFVKTEHIQICAKNDAPTAFVYVVPIPKILQSWLSYPLPSVYLQSEETALYTRKNIAGSSNDRAGKSPARSCDHAAAVSGRRSSHGGHGRPPTRSRHWRGPATPASRRGPGQAQGAALPRVGAAAKARGRRLSRRPLCRQWARRRRRVHLLAPSHRFLRPCHQPDQPGKLLSSWSMEQKQCCQ